MNKKNFYMLFPWMSLAALLFAAEDAPEWQSAGAGFRPRPSKIMDSTGWEKTAATPGFLVLCGRDMPRLGLMGFPGILSGAGVHLPSSVDIGITYRSAPYYCDFGKILLPESAAAVKPAAASGDWSCLKFEFFAAGAGAEPVVTVLASRASPALFIRTSKAKLTLFAERHAPVFDPQKYFPLPEEWKAGAAPTYVAVPAGDGVEVRDPAAAGAAGSGELAIDPQRGTWLLCWFGKGSGFYANNFPYDYSGKTHGVCIQHLKWKGKSVAEAGDCPVLVLFDEPPWSVIAGGDGMEITFDTTDKQEHAVAVLPLYGNRFIPAAETETWRAKLPESVVAQCRWWDEHLGAFPASVTETYKYNEADGAVTITEHVRFEPFREGGKKLAPLPPMAALALEQGFPLKLAKADGTECRWTPSSVVTIHGPYGGVPDAESFSWTVPGMGKLAKERPVAGPATEADARLARQLEEQVRRIVEAGHLAPWYCSQNSWSAGYRGYLLRSDRWTWSNPAETLYALAEAMPFLSAGLQAQASEYMRRERAEYPPERVAHTPVREGAPREWHWRSEDEETYTEQQQMVNGGNFYVSNKLIPEETLYFMSRYYETAGAAELADADIEEFVWQMLSPYMFRQDWATLGFWPPARVSWSSMDGHGDVAEANRHFAGVLGALRLMLQSGKTEGLDELWGMLARAAVWRVALGKYGQYLYAAGFMRAPEQPDWQVEWWESSNIGRLTTWNWRGPIDDVRQVCVQSPYIVQYDDFRNNYNGNGINLFFWAVPELGRFAAEMLKPELATFSDRYEQTIPSWFIAKATTEYGAEFNYTPPEDPWQIFMIRAWVLGETGEQLEKYLDIPWMARGDLYYIQKLVETIKAYRGVKWQKTYSGSAGQGGRQ